MQMEAGRERPRRDLLVFVLFCPEDLRGQPGAKELCELGLGLGSRTSSWKSKAAPEVSSVRGARRGPWAQTSGSVCLLLPGPGGVCRKKSFGASLWQGTPSATADHAELRGLKV